MLHSIVFVCFELLVAQLSEVRVHFARSAAESSAFMIIQTKDLWSPVQFEQVRANCVIQLASVCPF